MPCGFWALNYSLRGTSRVRQCLLAFPRLRDINGLRDLSRALHFRRDLPVDEPRNTRSGHVWVEGVSTIETIRLLLICYDCLRGLWPLHRRGGFLLMRCGQVLCGNAPYSSLPENVAVNAILDGVRPRKPHLAITLGFTDGLWKIMERCWMVERDARPDVKAIISQLNHAAWTWDRNRFV